VSMKARHMLKFCHGILFPLEYEVCLVEFNNHFSIFKCFKPNRIRVLPYVMNITGYTS
jgi:hypothetical protein